MYVLAESRICNAATLSVTFRWEGKLLPSFRSKSRMKIRCSYIPLACLFFVFSTLAFAEVNGFGMFNVYFSVDEALGYQDVRNDLAEVYAVGCRFATHYFRDEMSRDENGGRFWFGLADWLEKNPVQAKRLQQWKRDYGASLGWKLFFYTTYMMEAYRQTEGGLKVLIGEMYGMFPSERHDEALRTFVSAIRLFEKHSIAPARLVGGTPPKSQPENVIVQRITNRLWRRFNWQKQRRN